MKKFAITILTLLLFLVPLSPIQAVSYDFVIDTDTQISYTTGDNFVTVIWDNIEKGNENNFTEDATSINTPGFDFKSKISTCYYCRRNS